jgi:competence protein ComFC
MKSANLKLNKVKDFILDLIFPRECLGCGGEGRYLCGDCLGKIDFVKIDYCPLCKKPSTLNKICPACQGETAIKAVWVAGDYNQKILQDLIHNLKYNYLEDISSDLARILFRFLRLKNIFINFGINAENTILVPVPLHRKRFLSRGFNQSELLAEKLGKLLDVNNLGILKRVKNTQTQINLTRKERQENVKDAFAVLEKNSNNKKIILIDDVLTTGSTFKECAKVLTSAGFGEIYGLVIAQRED